MLLGNILYYFSLNSFLYNKDCTEIGLVAGNIHGLVSSIVGESLIPDYFTCLLLFIGLSMLLYNLTLEKSTLSIKDKIKFFLSNWKTILLIITGLFFLRIILASFGILLINTDSFILFSVSVFARIVLFQSILAVTFCIYFKKINYNLFALNIFTVLFIGCIVYTYVFILFPIINPIINLWYNKLYARSEDIYMNISNNLKICIGNYAKRFSLFINEFNLGLESIVNLYEYTSSVIIRFMKNTLLPKPVYCSSSGAWDKLMRNLDEPIDPSPHNSEKTSRYDFRNRAKSSSNNNLVGGGEGSSSSTHSHITRPFLNPGSKRTIDSIVINHDQEEGCPEEYDSISEGDSISSETPEDRKKRLRRETNKRYRDKNPGKSYFKKKGKIPYIPPTNEELIQKNINRNRRSIETYNNDGQDYINSLLERGWSKEDAERDSNISLTAAEQQKANNWYDDPNSAIYIGSLNEYAKFMRELDDYPDPLLSNSVEEQQKANHRYDDPNSPIDMGITRSLTVFSSKMTRSDIANIYLKIQFAFYNKIRSLMDSGDTSEMALTKASSSWKKGESNSFYVRNTQTGSVRYYNNLEAAHSKGLRSYHVIHSIVEDEYVIGTWKATKLNPYLYKDHWDIKMRDLPTNLSLLGDDLNSTIESNFVKYFENPKLIDNVIEYHYNSNEIIQYNSRNIREATLVSISDNLGNQIHINAVIANRFLGYKNPTVYLNAKQGKSLRGFKLEII